MENIIAIFLLLVAALLTGARVFAIARTFPFITSQKFARSSYVQSNILTTSILGPLHPQVATTGLSQFNFRAREAPVRGYYCIC